ncbi:MAG: hypothetical protein KKF33_08315 [Alphaproteobacteria bacterium]|jgi:uncharacterized membrane protein YkoI|nr:hypothetical protein [Alphaproteobacteria bacterium]
MKTKAPHLIAPIALALVLALTGAGAAQAECLDNRQIQDAVSSGQIMSLADVLASAGIDSSAKVLNVAVCDEGGRLVYRIGVLTASGEAQNLVLGAN